MPQEKKFSLEGSKCYFLLLYFAADFHRLNKLKILLNGFKNQGRCFTTQLVI